VARRRCILPLVGGSKGKKFLFFLM